MRRICFSIVILGCLANFAAASPSAEVHSPIPPLLKTGAVHAAHEEIPAAVDAFRLFIERSPYSLRRDLESIADVLSTELAQSARLAVMRGLAKLYPQSAHAHFHVADFAFSAGQLEEALEQATLAVDLHPKWAVAEKYQQDYVLPLLAVNLHPELADAIVLQLQILNSMDELYERARIIMDIMYEHLPLGGSIVGPPKGGLEELREFVEERTYELETSMQMIFELLSEEDLPQDRSPLELMRGLVKIYPQSAHARFYMATLALSHGRLEEALKEAILADKLLPEWPDAIFLRVRILNRMGRFDEVAQVIEEGLAVPGLGYDKSGSGFLALRLFRIGLMHVVHKKIPEAVEAFRHFIERSPHGLERDLESIAGVLVAKQAEPARLAVMRGLAKFYPQSAHAHFHVANFAASAWHWEEAQAHVEIAHKLFAGWWPDAIILQLKILAATEGQMGMTMRLMRRGVNLVLALVEELDVKVDAVVPRQLKAGGIQTVQEDTQAAVRTFQQFIEQSPDDLERDMRRISEMLATGLAREGRLEAMRELAALYPQSAEAHFHVANFAFLAGQLGEALEAATLACKLRANWQEVIHLRARVLYEMERPAEAIRAVRECAMEPNPELGPSVPLLIRTGGIHASLGATASAAEEFQQFIEESPAGLELDLETLLEYLLERVGWWTRLEIMRALAKLYPQSSHAHFHVAEIARSLGQADEALERATRAHELRPGWLEAIRLRAWLLQELDRLDEAVQVFREALAQPGLCQDVSVEVGCVGPETVTMPKEQALRWHLVDMLTGAERHGEARVELRKLHQWDPENPFFLRRLGEYAYEAKDWEEAEAHYLALRANTRPPQPNLPPAINRFTAAFWLGMIAEETGDKAKALNYYREVVEQDEFQRHEDYQHAQWRITSLTDQEAPDGE